jgi:hypothetical protein
MSMTFTDLIKIIFGLLLPSVAWAAAPDFSSLLMSVVFDGLIAALLSVAVIGVGVSMAKSGAFSFISFIARVTGDGQIKVGRHGFWDREVYEAAMDSLDRFKRDGGKMDRETSLEYNRWRFKKSGDEYHRLKAMGERARQEVAEFLERDHIPSWKHYDLWLDDRNAKEAYEAIDEEDYWRSFSRDPEPDQAQLRRERHEHEEREKEFRREERRQEREKREKDDADWFRFLG